MKREASTDLAVEINGLSKRFGDSYAVRDLSMQIAKGATFGFLGPNGAGKTTTIKMLMGLLRSDSGSVRVLGRDPAIDSLRVRSMVGYVPEQHFIHRWMRVADAINFVRGWYATWNDSLCSELLKLFELQPSKRVRHLSKGMVAKLALLLALAHEPELLILDEPMTGLDPLIRDELLAGVLGTVCDRQQTVLFSSHTLSDVQRLADTVGIIEDGRLLVCCAVDELLVSTKRIRAVMKDNGVPSAAPVEAVWQRVNNREWLMTVRDFSKDLVDRLRANNSIEQVEVFDLGLEDIFKDYVRGWRMIT